MGDEEGIHPFQDPLGKVMDLAAIEQATPPQGAGLDQEERVVEQSRAEMGLEVSKGQFSAHSMLRIVHEKHERHEKYNLLHE
jgi:hypothetical protein